MKSGIVAIVGAPNVGKSTLLNQILGFKLAITSNKPQTTRHRILGAYNKKKVQILFFDTPGLHESNYTLLNKVMMDITLTTLKEVNTILFLVEASQVGIKEGIEILKIVTRVRKPIILIINKIDLLLYKYDLLSYIEEFSSWGISTTLIPVSALQRKGIGRILSEIQVFLPERDFLFPRDVITDLSERFLVAELIREKVFCLTEQEVPYSVAVTIDEFLNPITKGLATAIVATIHVERGGQKAIIIGKNGFMIKRIGNSARLEIEKLLGRAVFLNLFTRVESKWSRCDVGLRKLGYYNN